MKFDDALKLFRHGTNLTRLVWNDPKQFVILEDGTFKKEITSESTGRFKYISLPYSFTHEDLLAKDWEVTRQPTT